ncbi:hypothetical protein SS05631_c13490 [Sinorhizobium sp. CCBAU 05631]|nr:hypothetical protein SS05631_c13490 [Sinorhizobium sp. CCBAU 05631]
MPPGEPSRDGEQGQPLTKKAPQSKASGNIVRALFLLFPISSFS